MTLRNFITTTCTLSSFLVEQGKKRGDQVHNEDAPGEFPQSNDRTTPKDAQWLQWTYSWYKQLKQQPTRENGTKMKHKQLGIIKKRVQR